jgi:multiple antibiotic resistance protein
MIALLAEKAYNLLTQSVALFTIMNSISAGAIMLTLVPDTISHKELKSIALKNTKAVFVGMLILFLIGVYVFQFFGISPMALRVFGGLILLFMGINMVQGHDKKLNSSSREREAAMVKDDISIVPLAIPIIIGPGLATSLITSQIEAVDWIDYIVTIIAIVIVTILNYFLLANMNYVKKRLGVNGIKVLNRLMGLVVGSLAVQMIVYGLQELWAFYS